MTIRQKTKTLAAIVGIVAGFSLFTNAAKYGFNNPPGIRRCNDLNRELDAINRTEEHWWGPAYNLLTGNYGKRTALVDYIDDKCVGRELK